MRFFFNFEEDIPEEFYLEETKEAFTECSVCHNHLGDGRYFIEKAYRKTHDKTEFQLIMEYAICERCKNDMMREISKESMENIQRYAMQMGMPDFENSEDAEIDMRFLMNHCIATGRDIKDMDEYHLIGIFEGNKIIQLPLVYGESFIEEYSELLSEKTKGFFDDFFNNITILPPALAKILEDEKPRRPVLI